MHTDRQWAESRAEFIPDAWRADTLAAWQRRHDAAQRVAPGDGRQGEETRAANGWLLALSERMRGIKVPVYLSDAELCDFAREKAREAFSLAESLPGVFLDVPALRARLEKFVRRYGITPPAGLRVTKNGGVAGVEDVPAIRRMTCDLWWRRRLRVSQCREVEAFAVEVGRVKRWGEVYVSEATVERRRQQRRRNLLAMEATECVNMDTGEVYSLADLAEKGVSNKAIRRMELMTRIAGFDAVSKVRGDVGYFLTLTTPSKYHRMKVVDGKAVQNRRWGQFTPRDASLYLTGLFQRMRAKWGRNGIRPYGFRVAEPHHDGTPHWHMLVFIEPERAEEMLAIFREYALKEDGNEPGAAEQRCDVKKLDDKRSAAAYVAKYISKNVDAHGVDDGDWEAELPAAEGAERVDAWASAWGIRQFQQIGGPPVSVWRELRRLEASDDHGEVLSRAMSAADAGNWEAFVNVMGGPQVARRDLPVRLAKTEPGRRWDYFGGVPYAAAPGQYGEVAGAAVYGLLAEGRDWPSRRFRWEMRRAANSSDKMPCFTVLSGLGFGVSAQPEPPRSPVNNCTQGERKHGAESAWQGHRRGLGGSSSGSAGGQSGGGVVEKSAAHGADDGRRLRRAAAVGNDATARGHRAAGGAECGDHRGH